MGRFFLGGVYLHWDPMGRFLGVFLAFSTCITPRWGEILG